MEPLTRCLALSNRKSRSSSVMSVGTGHVSQSSNQFLTSPRRINSVHVRKDAEVSWAVLPGCSDPQGTERAACRVLQSLGLMAVLTLPCFAYCLPNRTSRAVTRLQVRLHRRAFHQRTATSQRRIDLYAQ